MFANQKESYTFTLATIKQMKTLTLQRAQIINIEGFGAKETTTIYKDSETGNTISLTSTTTPWTWIAKTTCPVLEKNVRKILNKYVQQGIAQHDYKGGYSEATEVLKIKIKS